MYGSLIITHAYLSEECICAAESKQDSEETKAVDNTNASSSDASTPSGIIVGVQCDGIAARASLAAHDTCA